VGGSGNDVILTVTTPDEPSDLTTTDISPTQIDVSWTDNSDNEAGFILEWSPNGTDAWTQIADQTGTGYSHTGRTDGINYYYRVHAYNADGNSGYADGSTPDNCPGDPLKREPGDCGCGVTYVDTDDDGTPDCNDTDSDDDGMPDEWETANGLNPLIDDAQDDVDNDGLSNLDEYDNDFNPGVYTSWPGIPVLIDPVEDDSIIILTPDLVSGYKPYADSSVHKLTQWQISNDSEFESLVLEATGDGHLTEITIPDMILLPDAGYYWRARFIDNADRTWPWSATGTFTTEPPPVDPAQDVTELPLDQDLDGNGVPDVEQTGMYCSSLPANDDLSCITFLENVLSVEKIRIIDPAFITDMVNRPESLPMGLLSFRAAVVNPGDTALITIFFPYQIPEDMQFYIYDVINGWQNYTDHMNISDNRHLLTLSVTDGETGDADGVANGIIVGPSAPADLSFREQATATDKNSSESSGCFIKTLLK